MTRKEAKDFYAHNCSRLTYGLLGILRNEVFFPAHTPEEQTEIFIAMMATFKNMRVKHNSKEILRVKDMILKDIETDERSGLREFITYVPAEYRDKIKGINNE